jgi:hypothetical protein
MVQALVVVVYLVLLQLLQVLEAMVFLVVAVDNTLRQLAVRLLVMAVQV